MTRKKVENSESARAKELSRLLFKKLADEGHDIRWFHCHYKLEPEGFLSYPETVSQVQGSIEMSANLVRAIEYYLGV